MDFLHRLKDAITGNKSKSKRPSRGSDSDDHESKYDSMNGSSGNRISNGAGDYRSRIEGDGVRPRLGTTTYGSGSSTRPGDCSSCGGDCQSGSSSGIYRTYSTTTDRHGSQSPNTDMRARTGQGFSDSGAAKGSSHNGGRSGYQNAGYNGYSGDKMGIRMEPSRFQRNRW
ncbi:hypothetical protein BDW59DRAFT_163915 [Aspergillus cavernicola]|uniref:Uncharacterized protein n=1 Tax=Aspergillus cavernicola TaxID=176166 RepID=A0ABR4I330_9EURO